MSRTLQGKYADKLNKQIEELYKVIDAKDKIINEQVLEIEELKEQLENDIDRYEDTISYQLGFDKGKEYLQQKIDEEDYKIAYENVMIANKMLEQENKQLKDKIDNVNKYINDLLEKNIDKTIKFMLGDKE